MKELTKVQNEAMNRFYDAVVRMNNDFCMNEHPDYRVVATIPTHRCYKEAAALVKALEE